MVFSQNSRSPGSPRKRSPRKLVPRPVKRKSSHNDSQSSKSQPTKTLHHFFAKQTAKSEAKKALQCTGDTSSKALVIDSDDDDVDGEIARGQRIVRQLFSPSPPEKRVSCDASQETTSSLFIKSVEDSLSLSDLDQVTEGPSGSSTQTTSQNASQSGDKQIGIISPLKSPNVELLNDDTDDLMGALPEPEESSRQASQNYEAQTFQHAYRKASETHLISDNDNKQLLKLFAISEAAQELWLRLYQRKHQWILRSRITYKIDYIDTLLKELVAAGFLYDKTHLTDMKILLDLMPQKDIITLSRRFCDAKKCTSKASAIEELLSHAGRKDVLFGAQRIQHNIVKCGQQLVEQCYLVEASTAAAVTRVLILISLGSHFDTFTSAADKNDHGVCQLFTISQFMRGKFVFPEYTVAHILPSLFADPDEFILYCDARQHVFRLTKLIETHHWDAALVKFRDAYKWFMSSCSKERFARDASLPRFLQRFSYSYCLIRCLVVGAEIFERHRQYQHAVDLYYTVLSQTLFQHNRRGIYWNRLLLDIDAHLKLPRNSVCLASLGLNDSMASQHLFDMYIRTKRLCQRFDIHLDDQLSKFSPPIEAPTEVIDGRLVSRDIVGRRNVFASVDDSGEKVVGPEEVAIEYYLQCGYTNGVHGETRSMHLLFAVLCWDVLFGDPTESDPELPPPRGTALTLEAESQAIERLFNKSDILNISGDDDPPETGTGPPAKKARGSRQTKKLSRKKKKTQPVNVELIPHGEYFRPDIFPNEVTPKRDPQLQRAAYINEFQSGPLDLGYPEFYLNRKQAIDERLRTLQTLSSAEMVALARETYELHSGRVNPLFSWEVLSLDEVATLVHCIPVDVLVEIFRQLLVDFRFYRSGFPDVIMWNATSRRWKVVEVKGPGDILSTKQRYWMHLLLSLGVDCATCKVVSVNNKKIRA